MEGMVGMEVMEGILVLASGIEERLDFELRGILNVIEGGVWTTIVYNESIFELSRTWY